MYFEQGTTDRCQSTEAGELVVKIEARRRWKRIHSGFMFPGTVPVRARCVSEHKRSDIETHTTAKPPSHQLCESGAETERGWGTSGRCVDTCDSQTMPVVSPGTSSNQSVEELKARPQSLGCHCHLERGDDRNKGSRSSIPLDG
jgi:hypothetical protein